MYFLSFDVSESRDLHKNCITGDYLEINSFIDSTSSVVKSLCGYGIPEPISLNGSKVNLKFHSDASLGFRGFAINIETSKIYHDKVI